MTSKTILFRVDADSEIGAGHLMRCLALAQAWKSRGASVVFAMARSAPLLKNRLVENGIEVVPLSVEPGTTGDAEKTVLSARNINAVWIVVDGYVFDAAFQRILKENNQRVLFIDDYGHAAHYSADIILNQNLTADEKLYKNREAFTRLLLGARYALLRSEFNSYRGWKRRIETDVKKILVTIGDGDKPNATLSVIRAVQSLSDNGIELTVVAGGSNPHFDELKNVCGHSPLSIRLERNVPNMPSLMAWADMAVCGAGSTSWETAFMGLPNLVLVMADNQAPLSHVLEEKQIAVNLGWFHRLTPQGIATSLRSLMKDKERRVKMSEAGPALVDGKGAERIIDEQIRMSK